MTPNKPLTLSRHGRDGGHPRLFSESVIMSATSVKSEAEKSSSFDELDRVRLRKAISVEGTELAPGLMGTIVLCHGQKAFEVEFDTIEDTFGIPVEYLQKA